MLNELIYPLKGQAIAAPKSDIEKLHDYLIDRNGEGIKKVLLLHGYTVVSTREQMQLALLSFVKSKGEKAIEQILSEHPDYEMIICDYLQKNPVPTPKPKQVAKKSREFSMPVMQVDFNSMVNLLMFLVLVWLVLKIFKSE